MEEDLSSKWRGKKKKKARVAIPVSDKMDFKPGKIKRDIMVKWSMQQEELTILSMYTPNTGAPRYIKQVLNDLQRDLDIIILEDFTHHLQH